ncbi:MAG TPA: aminotransferase class I/II-fold pyridoxal phosphate-dependent enzyme [Tenuifilaceae bacterium]|nr:aminotransferase class I/II-fold pyridoxal phosphate-dependent enzyme [Tenuifilaceae bacterium]HPE18715.1 aminotransferase class I/II-fold pyridoxal phosphate-dependent enzyme [Tenuifilaceae bacterium]HPJ45692.1 aminotransferase class I/II-fold pyridoxal phosphate-dependent enzyme [Tenuifilaceae bacterium]HPQ34944.1 aminotransferase class I/II-fold pyridoxal phosphate-dependent enzyme [Tenuifilaceae bacterium]HRX68277.1 aminotransferase class I/II-fold pyridoxal phosphate-dependent enzyme [T
MNNQPYSYETLQIHAGYEPDPVSLSQAVPLYLTTAYRFKDSKHAQQLFALEEQGNIYSRITNPTTEILEKRITALEGGIDSLVVSSGHAAQLIAITTILSAGDSLVASPYLYGGTFNQLKVYLKNLGINSRFAKSNSSEDIEAEIDSTTKAIYVETIGNPGFSVPDFNEINKLSGKYGIPLIVDNTFAAAGFLCRPVEFGAHIVVQSATKWINGHGTVLGGVVTDSGNFDWNNGKFSLLSEASAGYHGLKYTEKFGNAAFIARARCEGLRDLGPCISPFNSFLMLHGLETLSLRVERQCENALKLAHWLKTHPKVKFVNYLGLEEHFSHSLAKKYFKNGFGSVLTFEIDGDQNKTSRVVDSLKLVNHVANVGDSRTLIIQPANTTHQQLSKDEQKKAGVTPSLLRVSVGLEHVDDIIGDFENALKEI